jgi:hypothetical protein
MALVPSVAVAAKITNVSDAPRAESTRASIVRPGALWRERRARWHSRRLAASQFVLGVQSREAKLIPQ